MKKLILCLLVSILITPLLLFAQPSKYLKLGINYSFLRTEGGNSGPGLSFGAGKDFYPIRSFNGINDEQYGPQNFLSSVKIANQLSDKKKGNHALWLQGGFGAASTDIYDQNQPSELFLHGELSAHFRRHRKTISIGMHEEGTEAWGIRTFWGTYGFCYSRSWLESTLSAGIGLSQWYHQLFMGGKIYSPHVPALIIRAQSILHLRQLFGFGLVLTGNVNSESFYLAGGFAFAFGLWNW